MLPVSRWDKATDRFPPIACRLGNCEIQIADWAAESEQIVCLAMRFLHLRSGLSERTISVLLAGV